MLQSGFRSMCLTVLADATPSDSCQTENGKGRMGIIHWRYKNIIFLLIGVTSVFILVHNRHIIFHEGLVELILGENTNGPCNRYLHEVEGSLAKRWPVIGILGPPGSGVSWLRYLIEQLTGIQTGSTGTQHLPLFSGEGKTKKVVAVAAHDISSLPRMKAGILMYRSMKDTIRSQFAAKHGPGVLLEAPMDAYYGKEWENFALDMGKTWTERYRDYIKFGKPLMIVSYEELSDPDQMNKQLIAISHFLHVPIKQSMLNCLVDRAAEDNWLPEVRPFPLRQGFNPFELLPVAKQQMLQKFENYTEKMVAKTRAGFVPMIHV